MKPTAMFDSYRQLGRAVLIWTIIAAAAWGFAAGLVYGVLAVTS